MTSWPVIGASVACGFILGGVTAAFVSDISFSKLAQILGTPAVAAWLQAVGSIAVVVATIIIWQIDSQRRRKEARELAAPHATVICRFLSDCDRVLAHASARLDFDDDVERRDPEVYGGFAESFDGLRQEAERLLNEKAPFAPAMAEPLGDLVEHLNQTIVAMSVLRVHLESSRSTASLVDPNYVRAMRSVEVSRRVASDGLTTSRRYLL